MLNSESIKFNAFDSTAEILTDKSFNQGLNFFNIKFDHLDTPYIFQEKHKNLNENAVTFSILHINIRSIKNISKISNFFLSSFSFDFSISISQRND